MKKIIISKAMFALLAITVLLSNSFVSTNAYSQEDHPHPHPEESMTPIPINLSDPMVKKALEIGEEDHVMGKQDAKVTIIEYASLSCPHCAEFSKNIFPEIKEKYIDTNKAKFVYRHFPLNRPALEAAMVTECLGKISFFSNLKGLFKLQDIWAFSSHDNKKLKEISKEMGLTSDKFDECVGDGALQNKVLTQMKSASEILGIDGTPAFLINGKLLKRASADEIKQELESAIKNNQ